MDYSDTNKGVLFQNDKDGNEKRPDYSGKLDVNGTEYRIAGWKRVGKSGNPFLSLAISEPDPKYAKSELSGYEKAKEARQSLSANEPDEIHEVTDEPIDLSSIPF